MSKQRGVQATNIINTAAFLTSCIMKASSLRESEHKYPIEICKTMKTVEFHKVSKRQETSKHLYSLKVNVDTHFIYDKFNYIDKLMANDK